MPTSYGISRIELIERFDVLLTILPLKPNVSLFLLSSLETDMHRYHEGTTVYHISQEISW